MSYTLKSGIDLGKEGVRVSTFGKGGYGRG